MSTPMVKTIKAGAKVMRRIAGPNNVLERFIVDKYRRQQKGKVRTETGPGFIQHTGTTFVVLQPQRETDSRVGIVLRGGCDLPSIFVSASFIRQDLKGTVAIHKDRHGGQAGSSSTRQLLQSLEGIPPARIEEAQRILQLGPRTFEPHLFDPTPFEIPRFPQFGSFPKSVIVLSNGSDLARTLHRHKEHGYLVDVGGWWLNQSLEKAIHDREALDWFKTNFESAGRITPEDFYTNMEKVITLLRQRTSAHVVVLNSLVVDPGKPTHNYQQLNQTHSRRRRDFHLALAELSRKLNFHVIDVDRALKGQGVREQVDFAHFSVDGMLPIAEQAYRVFKELEVV